MKTRILLAIGLLGALGSSSALAQTTAPGATKAVGTGLPSAPPPGAVPANATAPIGTSGALYPGGVPARNMEGGTQRADQPVRNGGRPAISGAQPMKSLNKGHTTTAPIRP